MCIICRNGEEGYEKVVKKEMTFTSTLGDLLFICTSCYNYCCEFENFSHFFCEECNKYHKKEQLNYDEYSDTYMCDACWLDFEQEETIEEFARANSTIKL